MNRYLVLQRIVELGSFTKAALELHLTQSAVSQSISSLEDELHIKLLNRNRGGVDLTPEGKLLYPHIEKVCYELRAVKERASELQGLESGTVRIATMGSISAHWLPSLIAAFQKEHPNIEFALLQGDYAATAEWIKSGAVDFGFVNPHAVSGIKTFPVKEGRMLAVLPPEHRLCAYEKVPLEELAREPFILLEEGGYSEPLKAFEELDLKLQIGYTIHDDYAIMNMVEAGLGVSMLAELMMRRISYRLEIRPTIPQVIRPISVGYKDALSLSTAARRFLELLRIKAPSLP